MFACIRAYTHKTTWVLDVSPGVGQTPAGPEELRSTKAYYTCRPYRCTLYIYLYICHLRNTLQFICCLISHNISNFLHNIS